MMMRIRLNVLGVLMLSFVGMQAQTTPVSQMEKLDRGVVAVPSLTGSGKFVSWRVLGTDDMTRTTFNLLRNGIQVKTGLTVSNYSDASGNNSSKYQVVTLVDGVPVDTSAVSQAWENIWLKLPLQRPAGGNNQSGAYTYSPNDCSVGDVDGDGQYELFVKWDPSNSKDNSQNGYTGNVFIDCYRLDGSLLWRIDLGCNIRAGAHYTQYQVCDFDGDGKAELICKTAPGSKDGKGKYVNQAATNEAIKAANNTKDFRNSNGRVASGHEYLTVFDGLTGKAIHTIAYFPNRNAKALLSDATGSFNWDDRSGKSDYASYGNRGERFLAATAYLDGPDANPSGIFARGYYTYAYVWAVDFDGTQLHHRWLHRSDSKTQYSVVGADLVESAKVTAPKATYGSGSNTMYGNGNHNMSVADVDGDGCDEIIWGSAALNNDGTLLYATGFGHGDAIHMGQMIPGEKGLQVFEVHEEKGTYAWDLHDAATGRIIYKGGPSGVDNGRGMAAQLTSKSSEWWFASSSERQQRSTATGEVASQKSGSLNFRMYWNGTVQDQLLDGNKLDMYNASSNSFSRQITFSDYGPSSTCNSTKNTPNLLADILGDWREELILYTVSNQECYLGIYSTNVPTDYAVPTLMHDHTYRMAVCWQNTAYNQPPHLGYNLAEATQAKLIAPQKELNSNQGDSISFTLIGKYNKSLYIEAMILPDGTKLTSGAPEGFTRTANYSKHTITFSGRPQQTGDYLFAVKLGGLSGETVRDTVVLHVAEATGIEPVVSVNGRTQIYDLSGHQMPVSDIERLPKGVYIIKRETAGGVITRKVLRY